MTERREGNDLERDLKMELNATVFSLKLVCRYISDRLSKNPPNFSADEKSFFSISLGTLSIY